MNQQPEYAIEVEHLTVAYDSHPVLWDVNLKIPKGVLTAIVGPNGAGKSTLIKALVDLIKPVCGQFRYPDYQGANKKAIKTHIAYVPQSSSVDWDFPATVFDVVIMGTYGRLGWLKRAGRKERAIALAAIEKVGMSEFIDRQIGQLSGGQQQRVFLARALAQDADIYLMDEPFKGVDMLSEKAIVTLLHELKEHGKTIVVVHHDLQTLCDYFDEAILLNKHLIDAGPIASVVTDANIHATYHGK